MAEERVRRRLAAILAADVVGYSRLMGADEAGTLAHLKALRADLLDPKVAQYGGRVVKTTGDGMLIEFASAVDAVQHAVDVQRAMGRLNADIAEDRRIALRIGINLGDILIDGDDIYGDGVNVAARLESLADPGGIVISDKVHQEIRGKIEFTSRDLGRQMLKNIAEPVRVHRIDVPGVAKPVAAVQPSSLNSWPALPDKPSIVVLPFANLSGDQSQNYFVDGLVEDFTVALGREKWLFVVSSPSAFSLKDHAADPRRVGAELGVRYVLRGSVRREAGRVRIIVQLNDVQSGGQIWSDRFEDEIDNVFAMQDRLMAQVVAAIAPELRTSEIERAHRKPTDNLSAFDLYLQALPRFRTGLADNRRALGLLAKAIALDPSYSSAYGLAARCYQFQKHMGWVAPADQSLKAGIRLAQRASELGTNDSEALWMAGTALVILDGELDQGPALIERSLTLNPSSANAWTSSCLAHACLGHDEIAIDHFCKAQRLNPLDQLHHAHWNTVGMAYLGAGRLEEADDAADKTLNALPTYPPGLRLKIAACGLLRRTEESGKYLQRLLAVQPGCSLTWMSEFLRPILRRNPGCLANYLEGARLAGLPE